MSKKRTMPPECAVMNYIRKLWRDQFIDTMMDDYVDCIHQNTKYRQALQKIENAMPYTIPLQLLGYKVVPPDEELREFIHEILYKP